MLSLKGLAVSSGIAIGRLFLIPPSQKGYQEKRITDIAAEHSRVDEAIEISKNKMDELYEKALKSIDEGSAEIFKIHRMMMEDDDFIDHIHQIIAEKSVCAEFAVRETGEYFSDIFSKADNEYMNARADDVRDITDQIIDVLAGNTDKNSIFNTEPYVFGAEELKPSQTVQFDKGLTLAFISEKGSINSHASILARSLGIPAVTNLGDSFFELVNNELVIVDGDSGVVIQNPDPNTLEDYQKRLYDIIDNERRLKELMTLPAITKGGASIELYANIGSPDEAKAAIENGAEGIGLFRSEFLFLGSNDFPSEEKQFDAYKKVLEIMNPRRVVIRTLDIGADKQLPYLQLPHEENPAMGYRAIRISLDRKELFIPQLRALLRASVYGRLAIMFPMITSIEEIRAILDLVQKVKIDLKANGIPYSENIELGIMVETPAAVIMADEFAKMVDFFSIGTNDLTQYTFAADRMNPSVSHLLDSRNQAILKMIKSTAEAAHAHGIWVGICGESAADISLLPFYIETGIDELSMAPAQILKVKEKVRSLD